MKYTPKHINEEISNGEPETITSLLGIAATIVAVGTIFLFLLNFLLSSMLIEISREQEKNFFQFSDKIFLASEVHDIKYLNSLKNTLIDDPALRSFIEIKLLCSKKDNAYALPGGKILITSGLIKLLDSENALATVIAHEIGHIFHRHHLKGLSFKLSMKILFTLLSFSNDPKFFVNLSFLQDLAHSRDAELEADTFAKNKMMSKYNTLNGASQFFKEVLKKQGLFLSFLSTHPGLKSRIDFFSTQDKTKLTTIKLNKEEMLAACSDTKL